jgi:hypothetical protein
MFPRDGDDDDDDDGHFLGTSFHGWDETMNMKRIH